MSSEQKRGCLGELKKLDIEDNKQRIWLLS